MEEGLQKRGKTIQTMLRECFGSGNVVQKLIPKEIWQYILMNTNPRDISTIAQICKAFNELVEQMIRSNNLKLAKQYLREGQTKMALRCLQNCVEHGNTEAMFVMGYAHTRGGWGLEFDGDKSCEYFKTAADGGNHKGMVFYECIYKPYKIGKASLLDSDDFFVRGYCYYRGYHLTTIDYKQAVYYFTKSAMLGDEYAQYYLGLCYLNGYGVYGDNNEQKGIEWLRKSAEQGLYVAQEQLSFLHLEIWEKIADKQRIKF